MPLPRPGPGRGAARSSAGPRSQHPERSRREAPKSRPRISNQEQNGPRCARTAQAIFFVFFAAVRWIILKRGSRGACHPWGMARTWLSVTVELLGGRGEELWPWPGRIFAVGPSHTFMDLADAINDAFARWDRSHLSMFTLADGRVITDEETGAEMAWIDPRARSSRRWTSMLPRSPGRWSRGLSSSSRSTSVTTGRTDAWSGR